MSFLINRNKSLQLKFEITKNINSKMEKDFKSLLEYSMYLPTKEKTQSVINHFVDINNADCMLVLALKQDVIGIGHTDDCLVGVMAVQIHTDKVIIHYISTKKELRNRGIGTQMILFLQSHFVKKIELETDDESVNFYKKIGFKIAPFKNNTYNIIRYKCIIL